MKYPLKFSKDLRRNTYPGKYFVIEGIDGSGKTTQIKKIKARLEKMGREVVLTSEPMSEGTIQEIIRSVLASKVKIPSRSFQALYSADRAVNHATIIEPALQKGKIVLAHRSNWSTIPHGIIDLGQDYSFSHHAWPIAVANGLLSGYHQFLTPELSI